MKQALADAIADRGYDTLTPVQEAVSDPALTGRDMLVSAQTGSGKTLGFGLAIAPTLLDTAEAFDTPDAPLALVIAPTRELALQVKRELQWLYAKAGAVMASCVGGMDMRDERRALARGAHIVVATPGRLRDHIMRGSVDLSAIRAVVLDEADEMLDLGFREDLEFILGAAPEDRQTLLFSATVPASITRMAEHYQRDAARVSTKSEASQHADIAYRALMVAERDTENAVINILRFYEAPNTIVFGNTRAMVNRLTTRLSNRGFQVVALSGELSQSERTHALQAMRDGRARVCVATDVAARGIDLPNLELVVHAELPTNHETLLHRSGRTGRAGRKGVSALIVSPKSRKKAERILKFAKLSAEWAEAPSAEAVQARDEERMLADPGWSDPVSETEADGVAALVARFTPEQIAAAFLRGYRDRHSAPEDLSDVDAKPAPRAPFGPSVWFSVSTGRDQGAEPRRLLPALCKAGGISRDDIGAIRVRDAESFVELRESAVAGFLSTVGSGMTVEDGVVLTKLATAPDLGKPPRRDAPQARPHRPKDKDRPARAEKPAYREKPAQRNRMDAAVADGAVTPVAKRKPAGEGAASRGDHAKRSEKPGKPRDHGKAKGPGNDGKPRSKPRGKAGGPPPPQGKPSSKKNRARAEAADPGRSLRKPGRGKPRGKG